MAKIYRVTDRIKVKVSDMVFELSPLTAIQKADIAAQVMSKGAMGSFESTKLALKYSIKNVQGLETPDGKPYELEFENGILKDACVDDLLNIEASSDLNKVCLNLIHGIPEKFLDPQTNEPIKNVEIIKDEAGEKKRKK